jgi:two-component system chemotaxis response regulator CheB
MRVVVLDDDPVFRTVLSRMLTTIGAEVVGACSTIEAAKKRLAGGDVDAVTVDVVLRGESGLDFLKWCHQTHKGVLTVLVTAGTERGARTGVDAVFLGAAALLMKPDARHLPGFEAELRRVFADGRSHAPRSGAARARPAATPSGAALKPSLRRELLAIGASTGGPPVLLKLLKGLPREFDVPIVITQHMPALHIPYLAELLTAQSGRRVRLGADGERVQRGTVYLAGYGKHLEVNRAAEGLVLKHNDGPPEHFCKPAVDPMFRSVARACNGTALGVVVTGMGADGAKGAVELRGRANPVLIQDEESSIVWGMPGSVAAAGAADGIFHVDRLPAAITEWMAWATRAPSLPTTHIPSPRGGMFR